MFCSYLEILNFTHAVINFLLSVFRGGDFIEFFHKNNYSREYVEANIVKREFANFFISLNVLGNLPPRFLHA